MLSSKARSQNISALKPLAVAGSSVRGSLLLGALSTTVIFAEMERRRCELEDEPKNGKRSQFEKETMKKKQEVERAELYRRMDEARSVNEFVAIFDSSEYQEALHRLANARKGEGSIEDWAEKWARSKHSGDPTAEKDAVELDHDRKLCLKLLYKLCDRWKVHKCIDRKEIISLFRGERAQRILDLCLVMDRANALYHMEHNVGSGDRGIHWVAKQHTDRSPEWKSLMGDRQCSMNKRLLWLYEEIEELGLQRETATNHIPTWIKPQACFTQISDVDLEGEKLKHRSLVGAPEKLEVPTSEKALQAISCKQCKKLLQRPTKTPEKFVFESICIHDVVQLARAFKYKNVNKGMIIFRGGRNYPTEKSGFMRQDAAERKRQLKKLLMCIHGLIMYFQSHEDEEGNELFKVSDSVVSTVRALTMLQHYAPLEPNKGARVLTPLLDVTKSPIIAASFAFQAASQVGIRRAIRFLLVGHPAPLKNEDKPSTLGRLEELKPGWLVQKLGDSEMLLVELQALLPASALRPQNQSGYILMHAKDLLAMHILCMQMACEAAQNGGQINFDALLETDAAKSVVGAHSQDPGFDSLVHEHATVLLGENKEVYCHEKMPPHVAKVMYPQYTKDVLYPSDDPTLEIVKTVVEKVEEDLGY